ncbi:MAG TPA: DUF1295 domain-containing protein [Candidatus Paceibacterota bacterium]|mgnify:CR=1 FL=1|nr:DUF1295 domain-containing protein [Candidatus Paceibacterota bacterium]HMP18824.1 DUF1295 domain-containing protein [Candidatus Paceibacterota bacterium]
MEFSTALLFSIIINILLFIPAFLLKTDKLTDLSYSISFAAVALFLFLKSEKNILDYVLLIMILGWSFRIGFYLLKRILKTKKDVRFDGIRESFWKFFGFWIIQAISVWLILLPTIIFFFNSKKESSLLLIFLGTIIFLIGLIIETIADKQKFDFKNNLANKDLWIETGLWKYSRHPNYFGEILVWIGIFVLSTSINISMSYVFVGIISPIYIFIILRYFSGIPPLEKKYDQRFSENKNYLKYKQKTNLLILGPNKNLTE